MREQKSGLERGRGQRLEERGRRLEGKKTKKRDEKRVAEEIREEKKRK